MKANKRLPRSSETKVAKEVARGSRLSAKSLKPVKNQEQITYLTGGRDHPIAKALEFWINSSKRFAEFVRRHRDKIRKKCINTKSFEDLEDMRFEMEIPYLLLLDQRFEVEYEKRASTIRRLPDFTVIFKNHIEFNIEVKRIRQANLSKRFDEWMDEVVKRISRVQSNLGFTLDMTHIDGTFDFLEQIEDSKDEIVSFIENTIRKEDTILQPGFSSEHLLPEIDGKFILHLTKLKYRRTAGTTSYQMAVEPLFYTQKEPYKFADSIFEKLTQMVPGMLNVLVCSSASSTHEREDLAYAIKSINSMIKKKDNNFFIQKGFNGIHDFLDHTKNLSGILFKGIWFNTSQPPNLLWCNSKAEHQLPYDLQECLSTMGCTGKIN